MKGLAGGLALASALGPAALLAGWSWHWRVPTWHAWQALLAHPQAFAALLLSLATGLASTALSLLLALAIAAGLYGTRAWERLQSLRRRQRLPYRISPLPSASDC